MSFPKAQHIVIIGIDGMGGFYIDKKLREACNNSSSKANSIDGSDGTAFDAICPTFGRLLKGHLKGFNTVVGTTNARTVFPPISSPAWGSILSGLTPDQTGMQNNDWPMAARDDGSEDVQPIPVVSSSYNKGIPRTIFDLVEPTSSDSSSAASKHFAAVSWSWLGRKMLSHLPNIHTIQCDGDDERVVEEFASLFKGDKSNALPKISFLHFDDVDHAGHSNMWGSDAYYNSWAAQDEKLARVLEALKDTNTLFVVISDHGGSEKGHGDMKQSHMQIPLIIATTESCPKIVSTVEASSAASLISCIDVVPTLLSLLDIKADGYLRGRVLAAYE